VGRCGLNLSGSGKGSVAGSCKHSNEPSGSIKGQFVDKVSDYLLLKKHSFPWSE